MISFAFLINSGINAKNIICPHFYWRIATISNTCQSPSLNNPESLYSMFYLQAYLVFMEKSCKDTNDTQYKSKLPNLSLVLFAERWGVCVCVRVSSIVDTKANL